MKFDVRIDKERCKGCALCVWVCKQAVLKMSKALNKKGSTYVECEKPAECTGCKSCAEICPEAAIEIAREADSSQPGQGVDNVSIGA
jgi:2-oxoglutarate ferredoxin oxidoreductase subunit delta